MFRKNVSDYEVQRSMSHRLAEYWKNVTPRVPLPPVEPKALKPEQPQKKGELSDQGKELLENIFQEPFLSVTQRSEVNGLSAHKMNELKKNLIDNGYARQFSVNLGKIHGGTVTMIRLTDAGYKIIGKKPEVMPENVGDDHWYWQKAIMLNYLKMNIEAEIEKNKNGKRADVGIIWNGQEIAIEVEMSPKNAVPNIVQDIQAGFFRVLTCCKNTAVLRQVQEKLRSYKDYDKIKDKVELRLLSDIELLK